MKNFSMKKNDLQLMIDANFTFPRPLFFRPGGGAWGGAPGSEKSVKFSYPKNDLQLMIDANFTFPRPHFFLPRGRGLGWCPG